MATNGTRLRMDLGRDQRGAITLEYLLVAMAIGLTTAFALVNALPTTQRQQTKQVTSLYGPYP
jgi:hypothetical protein